MRGPYASTRGRPGWVLGLLFAVALALGAPSPAVAARPDAKVTAVVKKAQKLLRKLEYQRARALLEASAREPRFKKARPRTLARLWALLGWARAELGDVFGTEEAFITAVKLDRRVKLPRGTSPKILSALERARVNAPQPEEPEPPEEVATAPEQQDPPGPDAPDPEPSEQAEPSEQTEPSDQTEPSKPRKTKPKTADRKRARPDRKRTRRRKRNKRASGGSKSGKDTMLAARLVGKPVAGARIRLVVELNDVPSRARIEAMVRRGPEGRFETLPMTRTGTTASLDLDLDEAALAVYARAKVGTRVVATAPPASEPLEVQPQAAPSIAEAWAEPPPPPPPTTKTSSTTLAAAPPPAAKDDQDNTKLWLLVGGGAAVAVGVTIAAILLAGGGSGCDAAEGFGCTEIQVLPLTSF